MTLCYCQHVRDMFIEYDLPKTAAIMDFGTGTGLMAQLFADQGFTNISGCDGAEGMLAKAKDKGFFKDLFKHWVGKDTLKPEYEQAFDVSVSIGCFLPTHFTMDGVEDMWKITKKGGIVCIQARDLHWNNEEYGLKKKCNDLVAEGRFKFQKSLTFSVFNGMKEGGLGFGLYVEQTCTAKFFIRV